MKKQKFKSLPSEIEKYREHNIISQGLLLSPISISQFRLLIFLICIALVSSILAKEDLPSIVKKIKPSIVVILTYDKSGDSLSLGSGFFISKDGDVISNQHVFKGANRAEIVTVDGKTYSIKGILAEDTVVGLIRVSTDIPKENAIPLSISSSIPKEGDSIAVIGNPLGLAQTVTKGIVSAVREFSDYGKIIQIDLASACDSDGSPVANMIGEIIGIAVLSKTKDQSLNFAIPGERIKKLTSEKEQPFAEWKAQKEDPVDSVAEALYATGRYTIWTEDYETAISYFEEAIERNPNYEKAYFEIGYCYGKLGFFKKSIQSFEQAIRIKPDCARAYCNLGKAYFELGRFEEAAQSFKHAIRIKPDFANAHCNLGSAYTRLGFRQEAIESFKKAIRINPDYVTARYNIGLVYSDLNLHEEAIESLKEAIRIKSDFAEAHYNLGVTYSKIGYLQHEIESYKQAIRVKPDFADAHFNLGTAYFNLKQFKKAVEAYKQVIQIKPDDAKAYYNLGASYHNLKQYEDAIKSYKEAIRIEPNYAEAYNFLGVCYFWVGAGDEDMEAYKKAIKIDPNYAEAHFNLGNTYWLMWDRAAAREEYEILKNLDKELADKLLKMMGE